MSRQVLHSFISYIVSKRLMNNLRVEEISWNAFDKDQQKSTCQSQIVKGYKRKCNSLPSSFSLRRNYLLTFDKLDYKWFIDFVIHWPQISKFDIMKAYCYGTLSCHRLCIIIVSRGFELQRVVGKPAIRKQWMIHTDYFSDYFQKTKFWKTLGL